FDRALAVIFNSAAPEDDAAGIVCGLQLEPDVESVDRAAWKEVSDLASANHDVGSIRFTRPNRRSHTIQRRDKRRYFDARSCGSSIALFTDGKSGRRF